MTRRIRFRIITNVLLTVMLVAVLLGATGCAKFFTNALNTLSNKSPIELALENAPYDAYTAKDGTWALYWYVCGSDMELRDDLRYTASGQIAQMMEVTLPDNVTVVIQAGGAKHWCLNGIDPAATNMLVYKGDTLSVAERGPQTHMGDPQTLADFLAYCNKYYPAENQAVILYDHGGGSLHGIANDDNFDMESIQLSELDQVIQARPAASGKYNLVGLCACLMSSIDSVSIFNGYTDYLVASEEVELGCTWHYGKIVSAIANNPNITGAELGKVIADGYYQKCEEVGYTGYTTSSTIDMAYADELLEAYNNMGKELLIGAAENGAPFLAAFAQAAYNSENYGAMDGPVSSFDMVDIGDLVINARELIPHTADAMLQAIDNAMAYHLTNPMRDKGKGISCYFPYTGAENFPRFASLSTSAAMYYFYEYGMFEKLSPDGQAYLEEITTGPQITADPLPPSSTLELDNHPVVPLDQGMDDEGDYLGYYALELGEKVQNVAAIYLQVGIVDTDTYDGWLIGISDEIGANWDEGYFTDQFSGTWGSLDGVMCYMEPVSEDRGAVLFRVPVIHNGTEKNMMVLLKQPLSASSDYRGDYEIQGLITPAPAELNAPTAVFEELKIGDVVEPLFPFVARWDDPSTVGTVTGVDLEGMESYWGKRKAITITANTEFYNTKLDHQLVYMINFLIIDYSGEVHQSKPGYYYLNEKGKITFAG